MLCTSCKSWLWETTWKVKLLTHSFSHRLFRKMRHRKSATPGFTDCCINQAKRTKSITVEITIKRVLQGSKLQPLLVVLLLRWIPCSSDVRDTVAVKWPNFLGFTFLVIVQFWWAPQCSLHNAPSGHVRLQPPPVQLCWHCIPLHSMMQLPASQSCRHDRESQTSWQPPLEHCCEIKFKTFPTLAKTVRQFSYEN